MRLLIFTLFFFTVAITNAQQEVILRLEHMVGDEPFELNTEYNEPEQGYNFNITRLQYYISQIEVTHDGGQVTLMPETWLLVDAAEQSDYELGSYSINSVEAISFWVGIEKEVNHLDPTQYPPGHPLAPQNPAMHWGWAAGYRFACLEGKTGFNLILTYQIHALGDANYHEVSFETGGFNEDGNLVIPVQADYLGLYKDIDVSSGLIEHSEFAEAALMLDNFSTEVYSAMYYTSVEETFEGTFAIGPNPSASGSSQAFLSLPGGNQYELSVFDMSGRMIRTQSLTGGNHTVRLQPGQPGFYLVQLTKNGKLIRSDKLILSE